MYHNRISQLINYRYEYFALVVPIANFLILVQKLPLDAQKEFLASNLTKDEALKEWDIFMQCIYFQCRTAFDKAPPEVLKKRGQLRAESAASPPTPQRTLEPSKPTLTRKRSGTCPAVFPSESNKEALEENSANKERKNEGNALNKEYKPKRDRSTSQKDPVASEKTSTKRAKSGNTAG